MTSPPVLPPERSMGADELDAWLAARRPAKPLAESVSMLDGFVTAVVVGPVSMHPQRWMCPLLALTPAAFDIGGTAEFAAIKAVVDRHNAIGVTLQDELVPEPVFQRNAAGEVDAGDWCEGFRRAVTMNRPLWKDVLDPRRTHNGLILPILLHCKDHRGRPLLGPARSGPGTEQFLKEAHTDIPMVVAAMNDLFQSKRYKKTLAKEARKRRG
jgi:uncharacterized protein